MKTTHTISSLFLLVAILTACTKENASLAGMDEPSVHTFKSTKGADESTVWLAGDNIGISAYLSGTNEPYSNAENKCYQTSGNGLFAPKTEKDRIGYPIGGNAVDFSAYYPYNPAVVNGIYEVDLRDQSSLRNTDLLYSNNAKAKNKYSEGIDLVFERPLSKLVIHAIPGEGMQEKDLHGLTVSLENTLRQAKFNLSDGTLLPHGEKAPITLQTNNLRSEAIVLPGTALNASIAITSANADVYAAPLPETEFLPGTAHHYQVTVNRTGIEIQTANITDWEEIENGLGNGSTTGMIYRIGDYYPNPSDPPTAIGVVYWISLGSQGRSGKVISLDTSEQVWSTNNSREAMASSAINGLINTGVVGTWDKTLLNYPAFHWCVSKGEGWYLPARYELHILREQWGRYAEINEAIAAAGGEILTETDLYLSSSESQEYAASHADSYSFSDKNWASYDKSQAQKVRAVIAF